MTYERFLELMKEWNITQDKYSILTNKYPKDCAAILEKTSNNFYAVYYYEMSKDYVLYFNKLEDAYFALACVIRYQFVDNNKIEIAI